MFHSGPLKALTCFVEKVRSPRVHPVRGLCITGLLILVTGIAVAYLIREESLLIVQDERFRIVLLFTATAAGLCFIAASARFWMRH